MGTLNLRKIIERKIEIRERVVSEDIRYAHPGRKTIKRIIEIEEYPVYVLECGHMAIQHGDPAKDKRKKVDCALCDPRWANYAPPFDKDNVALNKSD